jgi:hypothetical protein
MEIDAQHKTLKRMTISNRNLSRASPPVSVEPQSLAAGQSPEFLKHVPSQIEGMYHQMMPQKRLTREQEHALLVAILPQISDYARKLQLPIHLPIFTDQVATFDTQFFPQQTYLDLTNSYHFVYSLGYVQEFRAPYAFFGNKRDGRIEEYWGNWRMNEKEAVQLARDAIRKLGYSLDMLHLAGRPKIKKPIKIGSNDIPRYRLNWEFSAPESDDGTAGIISATQVEIDADKKCVRSITIYDLNLVRPPPVLPSAASASDLQTNRVSR